MTLRRPLPVVLALLLGTAGPAFAQEGAGPLSAIDWLSEGASLLPPAAPLPLEAPVTPSASAPAIEATALEPPSPDGRGLLSPAITGLPSDLWSGTSPERLIARIEDLGRPSLPAATELLLTLLLAEAAAPGLAAPEEAQGGAFYLARLDVLIALGALDQAEALVQEAGLDLSAPVFARAFDIALLTGTEAAACAALTAEPALNPSLAARIFCLARAGDWQTAHLTLTTARAVGDLSGDDLALLERFLDEEGIGGDGAALPGGAPVTPLRFVLRAAIGEPVPTGPLPLAFAHADLRPTSAWRARLEAAERLTAAGVLSENVLFSLYAEKAPAASGGVWDRAAAVQALEAALQAGSADLVAAHLHPAWDAMRAVGCEVAFARAHGADLAALMPTMPERARALALKIALLSPAAETTAQGLMATSARDALLLSVARGGTATPPPGDGRAAAVAAAFAPGAPVPEEERRLAAEGQLGLALVQALAALERGARGDDAALASGLTFLRAVGLEDIARRAALQALILESRG